MQGVQAAGVMMQRAVIYARVSTKKEAQATSIPAQLSSCRRRCERDGWAVIAEHSDDLTGRNMRRPGWQSVMRLCEARAIDVIAVTDRSRVTRNERDFWAFREDYLERYGVRIVPLLGIEVEPGNPYTAFMEEDEVRQAARFSILLGWKTRNGMRERLRRGYWHTRCPFGTRKGTERGVPVRDPDAWPVLLEMFERAARGATHGEVLRYLACQPVRAPGGGAWGATTVGRILANPFYTGEAWLDGEAFPLNHDCRVPRELWEAAQAEDREPARGGRPRSFEYCYLLPRVVCSHYAIEYPARRMGEPLPLYARYTVGRGGVRYPWYYRADRLRASGGVMAREVDAPLRGDGSLRAAVSAPALDEAAVRTLIRLGEHHDMLQVDLAHAAMRRAEEVKRELGARRRTLGRARSERERMDETLAKVCAAGDWAEAARAISERIARLRVQELDLGEQLRLLTREQDQLAHAGVDAQAAAQRVNAIAALWDAHAMPELRSALALLVDHVDLRLDTPTLVLKPVMKADMKTSAPTALLARIAYPLELSRLGLRAAQRGASALPAEPSAARSARARGQGPAQA